MGMILFEEGILLLGQSIECGEGSLKPEVAASKLVEPSYLQRY
jgi:hypothetical protein